MLSPAAWIDAKAGGVPGDVHASAGFAIDTYQHVLTMMLSDALGRSGEILFPASKARPEFVYR